MSILHQDITTVICSLKHAIFLIAKLENRFESQYITMVLSIEQALIKAANGDDFKYEVAHLRESCYKHDIDLSDLMGYLPMLQEIMKKDTSVKRVTSTSTVCDAMNSNHIFKEMLPTVHQLLRLYKTTPITSATSERTFSAIRQLLLTFGLQ